MYSRTLTKRQRVYISSLLSLTRMRVQSIEKPRNWEIEGANLFYRVVPGGTDSLLTSIWNEFIQLQKQHISYILKGQKQDNMWFSCHKKYTWLTTTKYVLETIGQNDANRPISTDQYINQYNDHETRTDDMSLSRDDTTDTPNYFNVSYCMQLIPIHCCILQLHSTHDNCQRNRQKCLNWSQDVIYFWEVPKLMLNE